MHRLVAASEDAFAHIRRVTDEDAGKDDESSMGAQGAAEVRSSFSFLCLLLFVRKVIFT